MTDVMLVFPPYTEARLFPYLSLPMLTAYLRSQGKEVVQSDLNILLHYDLFSSKHFERFLQNHLEPETSKEKFDHALASFLRENSQAVLDDLRNASQKDKDKNDDRVACTGLKTVDLPKRGAIKLFQDGAGLLLQDSFISHSYQSVSQAIMDADLASRDEEIIGGKDQGVASLYGLFAKQLLDAKPRVLGFSVTFWSQISNAVLMAAWAKKILPGLHVIFGGQQIMLRRSDLVKSPVLRRHVDTLGIGAGEETLLSLIKSLDGEGSLDAVPDMIWLNKESSLTSQPPVSSLKFDDLPPPDFTGLPFTSYLAGEPQIPLITCVGCYWGRCSFCSYGSRSYRGKSYQEARPETIADHCRYLVQKHGVSRVNFVDENTNIKLVLRAMRILNKNGVFIKFSIRNRMEACLKSIDFCRELAERGCVLMSTGYETNSQRLLDKMNKGVKAQDYQLIIDNLDKAGIILRFSVMGGIYDETEEEMIASRNFLLKNVDKIGIDVSQMMILEPGTDAYDNPADFGLSDVDRQQLRGNSQLSFQGGRMGASFSYPDGIAFEEKQREFVKLNDTIRPKKNVDLPPVAGLETNPEFNPEFPAHLALKPWVSLMRLQGKPVSGWIIADLIWQRFYRVPEVMKISADQRSLQADDPRLLPVVVKMTNADLVSVSYREAKSHEYCFS